MSFPVIALETLLLAGCASSDQHCPVIMRGAPTCVDTVLKSVGN